LRVFLSTYAGNTSRKRWWRLIYGVV